MGDKFSVPDAVDQVDDLRFRPEIRLAEASAKGLDGDQHRGSVLTRSKVECQ